MYDRGELIDISVQVLYVYTVAFKLGLVLPVNGMSQILTWASSPGVLHIMLTVSHIDTATAASLIRNLPSCPCELFDRSSCVLKI